MARKEVEHRQEEKVGFLDFPRDVVAQTRESAYEAYNKLAINKVDIVAMNFEGSDYLNSAGIGLVISLVEDATQAGRKVFAYGLSAHYRKLFSMVGLTERLTLVANEQAMRDKLGLASSVTSTPAVETPAPAPVTTPASSATPTTPAASASPNSTPPPTTSPSSASSVTPSATPSTTPSASTTPSTASTPSAPSNPTPASTSTPTSKPTTPTPDKK